MEPFQPFGQRVLAVLTEKRWSIRSFARLIERNPTYVSQVLRGIRRPPLDDLSTWFEHLGLPASEHAAWHLAAELEHCPDGIRELVLKMRPKLPPHSL